LGPAFRSNAAAKLQKANASGSITAAIGANLVASVLRGGKTITNLN